MNKKKRREKFLQIIENKYMYESENIYPESMTDREFVQIMLDYFLGEDYYVADPLGHEQINTIVACEIISRYFSKYFEKEE